MPAYSGKFQYSGEGGEKLGEGACELTFEKEKCIVTPGRGIPLAFDLGDVDSLARGDWDLQLKLFTGKTIALRQFGPAFGLMADELTAAWRDRTVACLLLEDLEEVARFNGTAGVPSEIRLYKSNIAILPVAGTPTQWRLADVDSMNFDEATYSVTLTAGAQRLVISKLGKKTDEFISKLEAALGGLRRQSAEALHSAFPFLDPDRLQRLLTVMPEGRSVKLATLASIHPKLVDALIARAVDAPLKPYFDALRSRAGEGSVMTGFKFIRPDEEAEEEPSETEAKQDQIPLFFWFFFPMESKNAVAWEATTGSGRATYFFRTGGDVESDVGRLTRGLALVNFRREPVYLPDDSLEQQPRFHRYAIGARKLPDLRHLRAAFMGRAIHSSLESWNDQVLAALR